MFCNAAAKVFKKSGQIDERAMKPYFLDANEDRAFCVINGKAVPIANSEATLRKDEWIELDQAVIKAARLRLPAVNRLTALGLNRNLANGFGKTIYQWETQSEMNDAQISMDGLTRGINDRVEFPLKGIPLPIVHKDWTINARNLAESRNVGESVDVTQAESAAYKVAEYIENMLYNGPGGTSTAATYTYAGYSIYGLRNFPQRVTGSLTGKWDDIVNSDITVGEKIVADVLAMIQASLDVDRGGPWDLHVPRNYETTLGEDYKTNSDKTIRQRIMEIEGIQQIIISDKLPDDNVILLQTTSDVIQMITGMPINNIQWSIEGGMAFNYKVMGIIVPRLIADYNNSSGIIHYTGS
jgi:uncharacterized linocin/CFP29 family protein